MRSGRGLNWSDITLTDRIGHNSALHTARQNLRMRWTRDTVEWREINMIGWKGRVLTQVMTSESALETDEMY